MTDAEVVALWEDVRKRHGGDAASEAITRLLGALEVGVVAEPARFVETAALTWLRGETRARNLLDGRCRTCGQPLDREGSRCMDCAEKEAVARARSRREAAKGA